jgi:hypothetical protein
MPKTDADPVRNVVMPKGSVAGLLCAQDHEGNAPKTAASEQRTLKGLALAIASSLNRF